jgi:diguanylate cyclase (GGDEF)-like protein/PAS domain S-box-containing protein
MDESVASRLLAFIEQTTDLIGVADDSGNVVYVNDATRRRLGLSAGEPIGLTTADLFGESAFERYFEEVRPAILQSGVWSGVIPVRTASGDTIDAWMTVVGDVLPGGDVGWLVTSGRDVTEWLRDRDNLDWRATHDELTGVNRRVVLADRLERALARARRLGGWVGVLFIDVDDLKAVNDTRGHQTGDRVLVELARRIKDVTREVDTVVRVGGDEFVVVIDGVTDRHDAELVRARLQAAATETVVSTDGADIGISVSIGMVLGDGDSDGDALLRQADAAMYEAKRTPGGVERAVGVDAERRPSALTAHGVSVALTQQLITPHYQPVVDLRSDITEGFQALARWGPIPAARFVDLVQGSRVAVALDLAILRRATADARTWEGPSPPSLYVHLSSRLLGEASFESHLRQLLERTPLEPGRLALEIPEPLLADADIRLTHTLRSLGGLGVRLVISNFERYNPQTIAVVEGLFAQLRLGQALTAEIERDPSRAAAAISLAHSLGLVGFAVGIETAEQRRRLVELGCQLGMGHLLGSPQPGPTRPGPSTH